MAREEGASSYCRVRRSKPADSCNSCSLWRGSRMRLRTDSQSECRSRAVEKPVPKVGGKAAEGNLSPVFEPAYARNIARIDRCSKFGPEFLERHEFCGERLGHSATIRTGCFAKRTVVDPLTSLSPTFPTSVPIVNPNRCSVSKPSALPVAGGSTNNTNAMNPKRW